MKVELLLFQFTSDIFDFGLPVGRRAKRSDGKPKTFSSKGKGALG